MVVTRQNELRNYKKGERLPLPLFWLLEIKSKALTWFSPRLSSQLVHPHPEYRLCPLALPSRLCPLDLLAQVAPLALLAPLEPLVPLQEPAEAEAELVPLSCRNPQPSK
jgi:hypothetical protein